MIVLDSKSQQTYARRLEKTLEQQDQKMEKLLADMASSRDEMAIQLEIEEMFRCHRIFRTSNYEGHKAKKSGSSIGNLPLVAEKDDIYTKNFLNIRTLFARESFSRLNFPFISSHLISTGRENPFRLKIADVCEK